MRNLLLLIPLSGLLLLAGCAGVGIVSTSDPLTKLNDAEDLFMRQDRPYPAERLIREAISIYKEQNDSHGLGNAHREYGDLLRSNTVVRHLDRGGNFYGVNGDKVTTDNRIQKSSEYYSKALDYYVIAEKQRRDDKRFDALTNVYYNMAWTFYKLNEKERSCHFFDQTLVAYDENIRQNPTAKPIARGGTVPEMVSSDKKVVGCE
jgi:tetratricopeptide (TPR) repeat protein